MWLLCCLFLSTNALADDRSEYVRLAGEVEVLAKRQAWVGVERAYVAAVRTGQPGSFTLHHDGAAASWARGDATATLIRLRRAHHLREDRHVVEWMYRIEHNFGEVELQLEPGLQLTRLDGKAFDPEAVRVVDSARAQIEATGRFQGLIPMGTYTVGVHQFKVGSEPVTLNWAPEERRKR